ncbi:zinc finger SWIM domain-containing protein 5-like [Tropilaelaps mercedesae]|uniref:Zinc finger SWIM domain-containing protein 5-like n=1 Tax=Tropilaelaps mercedesae TaxID=418985 RepID=A0A1V9X3H1_9ACAR|nr:zinc finger SWIM domain-containing protein 5-like [Tropilaelaps mercedesae]
MAALGHHRTQALERRPTAAHQHHPHMAAHGGAGLGGGVPMLVGGAAAPHGGRHGGGAAGFCRGGGAGHSGKCSGLSMAAGGALGGSAFLLGSCGLGGGGGNTVAVVSKVESLLDLSAKVAAAHIPFQRIEERYNRIPEPVQRRIIFWSFPRNERDICMYSSLVSADTADYQKLPFYRGLKLYESGCVESVLQVGEYETCVKVNAECRLMSIEVVRHHVDGLFASQKRTSS